MTNFFLNQLDCENKKHSMKKMKRPLNVNKKTECKSYFTVFGKLKG